MKRMFTLNSKSRSRWMLLLLFLLAGVTDTLAEDANVTISPSSGSLIAALTSGNEQGFENGWSAMWRHEQLPLSFTVSDESTLTDAGEIKNPAGNVRVHDFGGTLGKKLIVAGGTASDSYCVLSLPKGYRITGYRLVLVNNLNYATIGEGDQLMKLGYAINASGNYTNTKRSISKIMYETDKSYNINSPKAQSNSMGGTNSDTEFVIERNSVNETDMGNQLYFRLGHTNQNEDAFYAVTIKYFEIYFTAEGTFEADVKPEEIGQARSVVSSPFQTSKIDLGEMKVEEKNNQKFFAYNYENVRDLTGYNTIYQEDAVQNGVPAEGDEAKTIYPVKVEGENLYAFGNNTYFVEPPVMVHTQTGLEAPVGYRIVGARFNYLWGKATTGGTQTKTNYYITYTSGGKTYYLNDQLHFTTNKFAWSYDSSTKNVYFGSGDNKRYLSCTGSGYNRPLTLSSENGSWYNLSVSGNYIGWVDYGYYLRGTTDAGATVYNSYSDSYYAPNNAARVTSETETETIPSFTPGTYTLNVYDKTGTSVEKTINVTENNAGGILELEGLNNDAVKFQIANLQTGKQALVAVTLLLEALDPYINSMQIACKDANEKLQMSQTFSARDFKVSGGQFLYYVPEEYRDKELTFTFTDLHSDYGDNTYYDNTSSIHRSRYSFVTSEYFTPINGNGNAGLYATNYNPNAAYTNKVVAATAGNIRFKFNNAEDLGNNQTGTGHLEETPFSVAAYLASTDPDAEDGETPAQGAFNPVKLKASDAAQKAGTFYVFTADETRYNIAPTTAWQHRYYAFYRMDIEVQAKNFTPTFAWTKVYDKTCYDNNGDAEDSMWGLKLNTSDVDLNGKHIQGYLTCNQVINTIKNGRAASEGVTAIPKQLDPNNVNAPASMDQILYVDATDLLALVNTNEKSLEDLQGELGANALTFLPVNTTSTLDNVAVKTTSGSFRAGSNIVLTDKKPFYSPFDIQVGSANWATYTRDITVESTGMVKNSTVMLPFTLALENGVHTNAEGLPGAGKEFTVHTMAANQTLQKVKGEDYGSAYFEKYTEAMTEANKPYMIKVDENGYADEANKKIFIASQTGSLVLATTEGIELEGDGSTGKYYVGESGVQASSDKENFVLTNKGSYSGMKFDRADADDSFADAEKVFYFASDKYLDLRTLTAKKRYLYSYPFRAAYAYTSTTKTNSAKALKGFFISYEEPQGGTTGIEDVAAEADLMVRAGNGSITLTATRAQAVAIHAINGVNMNRVQLNAGETQVVNLPAGIYVVNNVKIVVK